MASRGPITANRLLAVMLAAAAVGSFLPVRFLGPVTTVAGVAERLTAPISALARRVADTVLPAETAEHPDAVIGRIRQLESLLRQRDIRIAALNEKIESLERGAAVSSDRMRLVTAPVVAGSIDARGSALTIRRGSSDGLVPGSVATVNGPNLLGYIVDIDRTFARVLPIDDRNAPTIEVVVYSSSEDRVGVRFDVTPVGDGTLRGPGMFVTTGLERRPATVQPGETAYLSDRSMPSHAGLEVGTVVSVDRDEQSPLRQVITIRPAIDTRRVSSVVVRIPERGAEGRPIDRDETGR